MKKSKKLPYIFMSLLIFILIFIVGMRYGQSVEKTNKVVNFILSITPTKAATPTITPTITYLTYTHTGCGIEFLYPSTMKTSVESSSSAQLQSSTEYIELSCEIQQKPSTIPTIDPQIATESVTLNGKNIVAVKKTVQYGTNTVAVVEFTLKNPKSNKSIQVKINKELLPIFERTLEYK